MNNITIEDIIKSINITTDETKLIIDAYNMAKSYHFGQYRASGEEYIIHPLSVAYYLAKVNADVPSICAGLLHDVLEDTTLTKKDITSSFGQEIASLVDGVTKITNLEYNSKVELDNANMRKIVSSLTEDVRIIIIKLADRLHNMRTLEYKKREKQIAKSYETLKLFVPLAYYLGAYEIKTELEDLSLKYIKPDEFEKIKYDRELLIEKTKDTYMNMMGNISSSLENNNINHKFDVNIKNIYGIYQSLEEGNDLFKIYDLLGLKVIVDNIENCYRSLWLIHSNYRPINEKIRDYIANPKPNLYRSLNTAVFADNGRIVQARIRTDDLDKVDRTGLISYYNQIKYCSKMSIQECFKENFKFYDNLTEIDSLFSDNKEFIDKVTLDLFSKRVNVYAEDGKVFQLPLGSTPIDLAYRIHTQIGNHMIGVQVNGENVGFDYAFNEKDWVKILTDENAIGPDNTWLNYAHTTTAKRRIKEFMRK